MPIPSYPLPDQTMSPWQQSLLTALRRGSYRAWLQTDRRVITNMARLLQYGQAPSDIEQHMIPAFGPEIASELLLAAEYIQINPRQVAFDLSSPSAPPESAHV